MKGTTKENWPIVFLVIFILFSVISCDSMDKYSGTNEIQETNINGYLYDNSDQNVQNLIDDEYTYKDSEISRAENCLMQNVCELVDYDKYIFEESNGNAHMIIEVTPNLCDVFKDENKNEYLGKFYLVYVGEQWDDRRVNWDWFYVSEDMDDVLWHNLLDDDVLSLKEWRASPFYRQIIQ